MNPPDLGINVSEQTGVQDVVGGYQAKETNPEILKQWVEQAFQVEKYELILMYIALNHPNADPELTGRIVREKFEG